VSALSVLSEFRGRGVEILRCGEAEHAHDPLLPFGIESAGHAWLHSRCWPAWDAARQAEAAAALEAMGIAT
jgi:hypothetical protein